jgi:hypothetical protein
MTTTNPRPLPSAIAFINTDNPASTPRRPIFRVAFLNENGEYGVSCGGFTLHNSTNLELSPANSYTFNFNSPKTISLTRIVTLS